MPVRPPKPPELSQEQREKIVSSESFQRFLSNSTRWIERAIALEVRFSRINFSSQNHKRFQKDKDIFADYANDRKDNTRSDALLTSSGRFNTGQYLPEQTGRAVDFSDAHPELVAVAINGKSNSDGPEGVINVWNTNFSTASPEYVLITSHFS